MNKTCLNCLYRDKLYKQFPCNRCYRKSMWESKYKNTRYKKEEPSYVKD